jgi:uncharacterized membrane protein
MKTKRNRKPLFRCVFWGIAILGAAQVYLVRELFFAWLMFVLGICMISVGVFFLMAIFETARAALGWVVPRIWAPRPTGSARLVRSH